MIRRYGKGSVHGDLLFKALFQEGRIPELAGLGDRPARDFPLELPRLSGSGTAGRGTAGRGTDGRGTDGTEKFLLTFADGQAAEMVVIPMEGYSTLCVSSQIGCARGCRFCETGRLGLQRSLTAAEIVSQLFCARFVLGRDIRQVVFMGMGEPADNLEAVLQAVEIMADQRGLALPPTAVTLSTVGHVPGIRRLADRAGDSLAAVRREGASGQPGKPDPETGRMIPAWHNLRLAVSLNAPDNRLRDALMPVNRVYPLEELLAALAAYPLPRRGKIFLEYVLLPGINDGPAQAQALLNLLDGYPGLPFSINLIPYNPTRAGTAQLEPLGLENRPPRVRPFFEQLLAAGAEARIRQSKGEDQRAACGQLAGIKKPGDDSLPRR